MRTRYSPIGVDLGTRHAKAVQHVRGRSGAWSPHAAVCVPRGEGLSVGDEFRRLAGILARHKFQGVDVVLGAPSDGLLRSFVELPSRASGAPLEQIALQELAREHKRDPESLELGWWEVPRPARGGEGLHAIAAALPREVGAGLVGACEEAGLRAVAIDSPGWALARAASGPEPLVPGEMHLLLDVGWSGCSLVMMHAGVIVYERRLPATGLGGLTTRLASRWETDQDTAERWLREPGAAPDREQDSALAELAASIGAEVAASITFASHRYPGTAPKESLIFGGASGWPGFPEAIAREITVPVRVGLTPERSGGFALDPAGGVLGVAYGLAAWRIRGWAA